MTGGDPVLLGRWGSDTPPRRGFPCTSSVTTAGALVIGEVISVLDCENKKCVLDCENKKCVLYFLDKTFVLYSLDKTFALNFVNKTFVLYSLDKTRVLNFLDETLVLHFLDKTGVLDDAGCPESSLTWRCACCHVEGD